MNRRKITRNARYMLAALALCALCACGEVKDAPVIEPETVNAELDRLRELGLFHAQLEVTAEDCAEAQPAAKGDIAESITINGSSDSFSYSVKYDPDMGQITGLSISANVQEGWEPSDAGVYGNYDAIMDPEMTIEEYCLYWAQYRGYSGCELPEGVDGQDLCVDASSLDAWICCVPMSTGPYAAFGDCHLVG